MRLSDRFFESCPDFGSKRERRSIISGYMPGVIPDERQSEESDQRFLEHRFGPAIDLASTER